MIKPLRAFGLNAAAMGATGMLLLWQVWAESPWWHLGLSALVLGVWLLQLWAAERKLIAWAIMWYLASTKSPRRAIDIARFLNPGLLNPDTSALYPLLEQLERQELIVHHKGDDPSLGFYKLSTNPTEFLNGDAPN